AHQAEGSSGDSSSSADACRRLIFLSRIAEPLISLSLLSCCLYRTSSEASPVPRAEPVAGAALVHVLGREVHDHVLPDPVFGPRKIVRLALLDSTDGTFGNGDEIRAVLPVYDLRRRAEGAILVEAEADPHHRIACRGSAAE